MKEKFLAMGKRKKLEQQTRRRQKLRLSPRHSDDDEGEYEIKLDSVPSQGLSNAAGSEDETLKEFFKEISEIENAQTTESTNELTKRTIWFEGFDKTYSRFYYYNSQTNESTWIRPENVSIQPYKQKLNPESDPQVEKNPIQSSNNPEKVEIVNPVSSLPVEIDKTITENGNDEIPETELARQKQDENDVALDSAFPTNETIADDEDLSPSPSEDVNVIINNHQINSLGGLTAYGVDSDSDNHDEREVQQIDIKPSEPVEQLEENSIDSIDIDAALESVVDEKLIKEASKAQSKESTNWLALKDELENKFTRFDLRITDLSPMIKTFVEFESQTKNFERGFISEENYHRLLQEILLDLSEYEASIPSNERLELKWCNKSNDYVYFDVELNEISDIKPLLTNLKYSCFLGENWYGFQADENEEVLLPENPPLPKETGSSPPPPPPPPVYDDLNLELSVNAAEDAKSETSETARDKENNWNYVETLPVTGACSEEPESAVLDTLPLEIEGLRGQINDPMMQYKVYKKIKKYAKQQSKVTGGSKKDLLAQIWDKLLTKSSVESPRSESVCSEQSDTASRSADSVDLPQNGSDATSGQRSSEFQSAQTHGSKTAFDTNETVPETSSQRALFPIIQSSSESEPPTTKAEEEGVVYCLPAALPRITVDDIPSKANRSSPEVQPQGVGSTPADIKAAASSSHTAVVSNVTKKTKLSAAISSTTAPKFKNKNMNKLVDKWTKVKKEISEDPDAIEGEFHFQPQSTEKFKQNQLKFEKNNPNLIQIDDSRNKLSYSKSRHK